MTLALFTLAEVGAVTRMTRACGCLADVAVFGHTNCPAGQPREAQHRREQGIAEARARLNGLAESATPRYTLVNRPAYAGTRRRPV